MGADLATWLLIHASRAAIVAALVATGVGLPLPEDLLLLVAGGLAHRTELSFATTAIACIAAVLTGDFLFFRAAKRIGAPILEAPSVARVLTPARRERLERFVARRGGLAVAIARHLGPLRAPAFALAAAHGMSMRRFLVVDSLAACSSVPLTLALGWLFSDRLDLVRRDLARAVDFVILAAIAGFALFALLRGGRGRGPG